MKTAISIQSGLIEEADVAAGQMGLSRSRLIALALEEFLNHRRGEALLVQLNKAYAEEPRDEDKTLLRQLKSKTRNTIRELW